MVAVIADEFAFWRAGDPDDEIINAIRPGMSTVPGAWLGEKRLRVYADGRIEGVATPTPENTRAPEANTEGASPGRSGGGIRRFATRELCSLPPTSGL